MVNNAFLSYQQCCKESGITFPDEPDHGLSRPKLLAATGEFDIQSIQFLSLADSGIEDLQVLKSCTNLVRLDLRQNDLSILTPLKNLKALTALNLSANRITNIGEEPGDALAQLLVRSAATVKYIPYPFIFTDPLGELENLVDLNLSGNLIGSFERLQCLQRLEKLEKLRLFDSIKKLSNPVCHNLSYDDKLRCMFPNLVMLDGMFLHW